MKKISLLMLFLSAVWGHAQVKNYTFTKSTNPYIEIPDGTVLGNESSDFQRFVNPSAPAGGSSPTSGPGFDIGFPFTFNGFVYDKFAVVTDGWISLGNSNITGAAVNTYPGVTYVPLSATTTSTNDLWTARIAALGGDLQAQTGASISYKLIGDAPSRTLVVQWKGYKKKGAIGVGDNLNFQIRLNETTNKVDIIYGSMVSTSTAQNCQIGLRAAPAATATNFANRKSTGSWDSTVDGTDSADSVLMNDYLIPSNGLTFTWTPPTCGSAKDLVASSILNNGATLNWGTYTPTPDSYEYIVSASATLPLSTDSGTATTNPTGIVTGLNAGIPYNVFIRTKCGSAFASWILCGTFITLCSDAIAFYEDFDSYTYNGMAPIMPGCWANTGTTGSTGKANIVDGASSPMSAPNALLLTGATGSSSVAYGVMPSVSNLSAGTNRLRFKAYGELFGAPLDVGYFTDITDASTFTTLYTVTMPGITPADALEFTYAPLAGVIPSGIKNLVFRNNGAGAGTTSSPAHIDDVVWEPTPTCADVKALVAKGFTDTSMKLTWTKGGSETKWQYVYALTTVQNPNMLTPVDVSSTSITLNGLTAATNYKIWVRSKCSDTDLGAWMGPVVFSTTCSPVSQFMENFEASATALPSCWQKVGTTGTVSPSAGSGTSGSNALQVKSLSSTDISIVTLPPVSNAGAATNRLRFNMAASIAGASIDIGYLTDVSDPSSFVLLETLTTNNTTSYDSYTKAFGAVPQSAYLAFRNLGVPASTVFLDDVAWEPIPACPNITAMTVQELTGVSAGLSWTAGGSENAWQYAIGAPTLANPSSLTPVDVPYSTDPSVTISSLTPLTSYSVWVRSKCADSSFGAWIGPVSFTTICASITDFSQSFDTSTYLPSCWNQVSGNAFVTPTTNYASAPNVLVLSAGSVCSMPPVSNAGDGTHRLKFKFKSSAIGGVLEVGFLLVPSDPNSFSSLQSFTATQTSSYDSQIAELDTDPTTDVLAFRSTGGTINIDDVVWEMIPVCPNVTNFISTGVTGNSIEISWVAGGSEKNWQYAIGPVSTADPNTLTAVDVSTTAVAVGALSPVTSYKIWVRSKCSVTAFGTWIGPIVVSTICPTVDSFSENFDASLDMPSCWNKVGNSGSGYPSPLSDAPSGPNTLYLYANSVTYQPIVSMPPISNATATDHTLKFKYSTNTAGCVLEVGYLTNPSDPASFVPFKSIVADSTTDFKSMVLGLGSSPMSNVLAFRHTGTVTGYIYIDDVSWDASAAVLGVNAFDEINFSYYPNPVNDVLNLAFNQEINNVSVVNLLGQQVVSKTLNANEGKIDMSGLSLGTYLVRVTVGDQLKTIKVVKE